jgi:hypothetical protein
MIEIQKQMFITTLYIVYAQIFKTTFIGVLASSAVDGGFEARIGQTKD